MRSSISIFEVLSLVAIACATVAPAAAQVSAPKHEFGVDIGISSVKRDGDGARTFQIVSPLDVRIGFLSDRSLMYEGRLTLSYFNTEGASGYSFRPGLNALWRIGEADARGPLGGYVTVGAALQFVGTNVDDNSTSFVIPGFNAGIGHRSAFGSGAFRAELFVAHALEHDEPVVPSTTAFGVRLGISVWH